MESVTVSVADKESIPTRKLQNKNSLKMFFLMFAKVKKIKTQYRNIALKIKCFYLCCKISFLL